MLRVGEGGGSGTLLAWKMFGRHFRTSSSFHQMSKKIN